MLSTEDTHWKPNIQDFGVGAAGHTSTLFLACSKILDSQKEKQVFRTHTHTHTLFAQTIQAEWATLTSSGNGRNCPEIHISRHQSRATLEIVISKDSNVGLLY